MNRILRVGLQQGIRSITLILLPISFITLVAWATAGSSSGNTADPLRAGLWIFLAAHQVPLQLSLSDATSAGSLAFLPVGALLIPFFALRSGYLRMVETLGVPNGRKKRSYILSLATNYSIISFLLALPTLGGTVKVPFYIAFPIILTVSTLATFIASGMFPSHKLQFPWQHALRLAWIVLIALIGFGSVVVSLSLIYHFRVVENLTQVVEPGIFGGLVLLIGQILYIPNIAIAALSYISGAGVTIGAGSLLSPFIHRIDEIPAIPILGALPATSQSLIFLASLPIIAFGALVVNYGGNAYRDEIELKRFYISFAVIFCILLLLVARISSGELMSPNLPSVGALWWALPLVVTAEILLGGAIYIFTHWLLTKLRSHRAHKRLVR